MTEYLRLRVCKCGTSVLEVPEDCAEPVFCGAEKCGPDSSRSPRKFSLRMKAAKAPSEDITLEEHVRLLLEEAKKNGS